jgi:signal peptidase I
MKRLKLVTDIALGVTAISSLVMAIFFIYFQASFVTITSKSMEPALKLGDLAITQNIPRFEIERGDILVLPHPANKEVRFAHRVVQVDREKGALVIETKGDANPSNDAWRLQVMSQEVPKISIVLHRPRFLLEGINLFWILPLLGLAIFRASALD